MFASKIRSRCWLLVALLVGASLFGAPTHVYADYAVRVYDDGNLEFQGGNGVSSIGTGGVLVVGNSLIFTATTTNFSITSGSGSSNNPGTQGGSNLGLSNNETITSTFGVAGGTHTIRIELSQDGFTAPTGTPLTLSSSAGGSFDYLGGTNPNAQQSVAATYQGFLASSPGPLFGQPAGGSTPIQVASASRTTAGTSPLVFSPGTSVNNLVPGGTPFSLTDVLTFTFTLDAGSGQTAANVSASTVASVPAPAGVVLALSGLPVLGIGTWLRRRRQAV